MRKALFAIIIVVTAMGLGGKLMGQTVCPGFSVVVNTPEDELTLAYNGAENPQDQVAALDKFMQANADSKFVPCAEEYYTMAYLKLNNYDKVIEHGEKALTLNHRDMMVTLNLARAYVALGKVSDAAFDAILGAGDVIKTEGTPSRQSGISDDEFKKIQDEAAAQTKDWRAYVEYAFFQLIQREPDGNKRVQWLEKFAQTYPDSPNVNQLNFNFFLAYKMANQADKEFEYGEKAVTADPGNAFAANLLAYDYAFTRNNPGRAAELAKKALDAAQGMKKPEGVPDDQFKKDQDNQLGMAHLTLGYASYAKEAAAKSRKVGPAIEDLKAAAELLAANPNLQGQALYLLGNAYEFEYPPNHAGAIDALTKAAGSANPWQPQAQDLLGKVKKAAKK